MTNSSAVRRRISTSPHTCERHARMTLRERSASESACSEYSSSRISPDTYSHLQVPQLPASQL